jgi:hypothetical protein
VTTLEANSSSSADSSALFMEEKAASARLYDILGLKKECCFQSHGKNLQ